MLRSHNKTIFEILGRYPIHPFPARMSPGIALDALRGCKRPVRVLDPMSGSGTALAVARAYGHRSVGIDMDPLAILLAGVWTRTIDVDQVTDKAGDVLSRAKVAFKSLSVGQAYPIGSDPETRAFLRYWFDEYARSQLAALSFSIRRIHDVATREALWCGFSRLIISKTGGGPPAHGRFQTHHRPTHIMSLTY